MKHGIFKCNVCAEMVLNIALGQEERAHIFCVEYDPYHSPTADNKINDVLLSMTLHQDGGTGLGSIEFIPFLVDLREGGLRIESSQDMLKGPRPSKISPVFCYTTLMH